MGGGSSVYFMKATESSPGRGPLSREELVEALVPDLIRQTATIRGENDTEWRPPDASLLAEIEQRKSDRQRKALEDVAARERGARQVNAARVRRGIMILFAGVCLTLLTHCVADAVGGRTFVVFTGLMIWGVVDIIRGLGEAER